MPGGAGVLERRGEQAVEAGPGQRIVVAAVGEQPLAAARDDEDPIQIAVGKLDRDDVAAQFVLGDVPDDGDVRGAGARGRGAGQDRERTAVPRGAQGRR